MSIKKLVLILIIAAVTYQFGFAATEGARGAIVERQAALAKI